MVTVGFLKNHPKLHKLNRQQILEKKLDQIKFRPVIDARASPIIPHNIGLMFLLRELNEYAIAKTNRLKDLLIKYGTDFSKIF